MGRLADAVGLAATVAERAYACEVKYPAAALAYYAFVSFIPVLLLVFAFLGEQFATRIYTETPQFLTREAQRLVYEATTTASGRAGAGVLAVLVLAWSATNVVIGVLAVVGRVEDAPSHPLGTQLREATVILTSFVLAIVAIVATSVFFPLPPDGPLFGLVGFVVLFAALTGAFVPLYYVPSIRVSSPTAALPGALTAGFGWTVIHTGVLFYAANATQYAIYGVLSGVIIMLTSLYIAAAVLLTGIIVNATLAEERTSARAEMD